MKYIWLLPLLLIAGCSKPAAPAAEPEPVIAVTSATVAPKTVHELLPLDGVFVLGANDYAKLAPQATGKIAAVLVKDGDRFTKGQILARLDASVVAAQQQSATAALGVAQAQAAQSAAGLRASQADFQAGVKTAQIALDAARLDRASAVADATVELQKVKAGARPQEIAQAEQSVRQAEVSQSKAKSEADRDAALLKDGYVSGQQADASAAAYQLAQSALISARSQLDLIKAGARPEDLKSAQQKLATAQSSGDKKVQAAQAALDQAKQGQFAVSAKQKELEAAQLGAAQKSADVRAAGGQTAYSVMRAPFDGVVTKVSHGAGEAVDPTTPILEVARKGAQVEFAGQLSPTNAGKVRAGMLVQYGDTIGSVKAVGVADAATGQVPVRVIFAAAPPSVTAGLPTRVQIQLSEVQNAPAIPDGAVITRDEKTVVFVIVSGAASTREVVVGPSEGGFTAITKGLQIGDKVVLVGQHELSDGAKVEDTAAADKAGATPAGDSAADSKTADPKAGAGK